MSKKCYRFFGGLLNAQAKWLNKMSEKGMPAGAWIQFPNMEAYKAREQELLQAIADSDGNDDVVIYLRDIKNIKILPANLRVKADETLMEKLASQFGKENVKFITKPIENRSKID